MAQVKRAEQLVSLSVLNPLDPEGDEFCYSWRQKKYPKRIVVNGSVANQSVGYRNGHRDTAVPTRLLRRHCLPSYTHRQGERHASIMPDAENVALKPVGYVFAAKMDSI